MKYFVTNEIVRFCPISASRWRVCDLEWPIDLDLRTFFGRFVPVLEKSWLEVEHPFSEHGTEYRSRTMSTLSTVSRNRILRGPSERRVLNGPRELVSRRRHGDRDSADSCGTSRATVTRDSRFIKYVLTSALQSTKSKGGARDHGAGTPADPPWARAIKIFE